MQFVCIICGVCIVYNVVLVCWVYVCVVFLFEGAYVLFVSMYNVCL